MPFYNRSPITYLEYKFSFISSEVLRENFIDLDYWPKVSKINEDYSLWNCKFGAKSQEKQPFEQICTGDTVYLNFHFRIFDYTVTGCYVYISAFSASFYIRKTKISTQQKLIYSDYYYTWNSKAPAPITYGSLLL